MKVELRKGNLVDKFSVKGELSEVIEKLKKLYICQIEVTQDLIICKISEVKEVCQDEVLFIFMYDRLCCRLYKKLQDK